MSDKIINNNPAYLNDPELIEIASNKVFGFWIYLMSDCILFATLFATFAVLSSTSMGTQSGHNLFDLHSILIQTFCLLISSFTFGLVMHSMNQQNKTAMIMWLGVTFILGLSFVGLEIYDFHNLISSGNGPEQSAYWSSFFSLVGTHGLHVSFGLLWMAVMIVQVRKKGLTLATKTRLVLLSLFWHFLDIIWVCIFTFVYLMGSYQ